MPRGIGSAHSGGLWAERKHARLRQKDAPAGTGGTCQGEDIMSMTSRANAPLRGGVIGCGFFAQNHLHSWAALRGTGAEGVELAAVCDRDGAKAQAAAERFGIPK